MVTNSGRQEIIDRQWAEIQRLRKVRDAVLAKLKKAGYTFDDTPDRYYRSLLTSRWYDQLLEALGDCRLEGKMDLAQLGGAAINGGEL